VAETAVTEQVVTEQVVTETDAREAWSDASPGLVDSGQESGARKAAQRTAGSDRTQRSGSVSEDLLVEEGDVAGDYLERLLDVVDYDGDIDLDVEGDRAVVSIDGGADLEKLIGPRGAVLEALQELTRLAVHQQTGARSRLMLDIAGWRSVRRGELSELGRSAAERVRDGGEPARLQPMTPFERKIVHDAVASVAGVYSESEGDEPRRRVVVFPST